MSFELGAALRALKPQSRTSCPALRSEGELPWVQDEAIFGAPLLLDTMVYIDVLQGRTPLPVDKLLQMRVCNHSAVALAELTHAFGRLDPQHSDTEVALQHIRKTVTDIPPYRLFEPDDETWGRAGILAGLIFRLRKLPKKRGHERKLLNDALLYLQARKSGCPVLTRNVEDFDILNQLIPSGRVLFYKL